MQLQASALSQVLFRGIGFPLSEINEISFKKSQSIIHLLQKKEGKLGKLYLLVSQSLQPSSKGQESSPLRTEVYVSIQSILDGGMEN